METRPVHNMALQAVLAKIIGRVLPDNLMVSHLSVVGAALSRRTVHLTMGKVLIVRQEEATAVLVQTGLDPVKDLKLHMAHHLLVGFSHKAVLVPVAFKLNHPVHPT